MMAVDLQDGRFFVFHGFIARKPHHHWVCSRFRGPRRVRNGPATTPRWPRELALCPPRTFKHSCSPIQVAHVDEPDRKSTRLNSSHSQISYAVFCLKKKN